MSPEIERMVRLMKPLDPVPDNDINWDMAKSVFGIDFPSDFKELAKVYGNVVWCEHFSFLYPNTTTLNTCIASKTYIEWILSIVCKYPLVNEHNVEMDLTPYPAEGGLLPCVTDFDSGFILWRMNGPPDMWTTVWWYSGVVTEFPVGIGKLMCSFLDDAPPGDMLWGGLRLFDSGEFGLRR